MKILGVLLIAAGSGVFPEGFFLTAAILVFLGLVLILRGVAE